MKPGNPCLALSRRSLLGLAATALVLIGGHNALDAIKADAFGASYAENEFRDGNGAGIGDLEGLIASLDYTSLIFAVAIGWVIWGDTMTPVELTGAAIVMGSALFIAYRERRRHGQGPSDRPAGT